MKTWQAILAHVGITAAQAFVAAPVLSGNSTGSIMGNVAIQTGAQIGLTLLQGWLASKNSNTDPAGNPLVKNQITGGYTSKPTV